MVSGKTAFALTLLLLLIAANVFMLMGFTNYPKGREGFADYLLGGAPSGSAYQAMGIYDNIVKPNVSTSVVDPWRGTAPNEAKLGPEFEVGPDSLFMFKDNQCKPECCGASFSCSGGCVCTTERDRAMINTRGGNRTIPGAGDI